METFGMDQKRANTLFYISVMLLPQLWSSCGQDLAGKFPSFLAQRGLVYTQLVDMMH